MLLILLPIVTAALCHWAGKKHPRSMHMLALAGALLEFLLSCLCLLLPNFEINFTADHALAFLGPQFALDGFRKVYLIVISFLWLETLVFTEEYFAHYQDRARYYLFNLLTLGLMMGEFLSANLLTAFVFLTLMTGSCYVWMKHENSADAEQMGRSFLRTGLLGCALALLGVALLQWKLGSTALSRLPALAAACEDRTTLYVAGGCLLAGFGARAGMFPLHGWLTRTHPVPAPGSALVSGLVTKSGIWGVLALSCYLFRGDPLWGSVIVLFGTLTMLTGALLALLSVNLKRTLACSSVSQIGFILIGIGMMGLLGENNALAAYGTLLHMVNHSLFKLVLYLCAGTVVMNLHRLELNDIRGFGRKKPLLLLAFVCGALGIGGVPLFSGYISKTLLHEAILEGAAHTGSFWLTVVEWLFLLTGGMTLAYMCKLFTALFLDRHPTRQAEFEAMEPYMKKRSGLVLLLPALLVPVLGVTAPWTMDRIAAFGTDFFAVVSPAHAVHYFSPENLKGALISVALGALLYLISVWKLRDRDGNYLEWPPNRPQ